MNSEKPSPKKVSPLADELRGLFREAGEGSFLVDKGDAMLVAEKVAALEAKKQSEGDKEEKIR